MFFRSKSTSKNFALFFALVIFLPGAFLVKPQSAEAIPVTVVGDIPHKLKEWGLDNTIGWAIANTLIAAMGDDIVNWINSGFQGDPLFMSNPEAFFGDVANEVSGQFINEINASAICEPWRPQITIALAQQKSFLERSQCTFLDAVDNVEDFINDFENGGWQGWLSLTQHPENNPYGAYFIAVDEHTRRLAQKVGNARDEINQNQGFFSLKRCVSRAETLDAFGGAGDSYPQGLDAFGGAGDPYPQIDAGTENPNDPKGPCLRWETQTPGQAIVGSLNESLGAPLDRLGEADELTEGILSAIMNALINQVVIGGLRSLSDSGADPESNVYVGAITGDADALIAKIDDALGEQGSLLGAETKINELKTVYDELSVCLNEQKGIINHEHFRMPFDSPEARVPSIADLDRRLQEIAQDRFELNQTQINTADMGPAVEQMLGLRERIQKAKEEGTLTARSVSDFELEFKQIQESLKLETRGQDIHTINEIDRELELRKQELEECKQGKQNLEGFISEEPGSIPVEVTNFPDSGGSGGEDPQDGE